MDVEPRKALEELCTALLVSGMEFTRLPLPISQYVSSILLIFTFFFFPLKIMSRVQLGQGLLAWSCYGF